MTYDLHNMFICSYSILFNIQVGYWLGGGPAAGLCSAWTPATGLLTYVGDEVTSLPCNQTSALAGDISMQVIIVK